MSKGIIIKHQEVGFPNITTFELEQEDVLHQMYRLIGCDTVQMVQFDFDGKLYDIWCDEEGKFKKLHSTFPLSYHEEIYDVIFGNILILASDDEGETVGLSDEVIEKMLSSRFFERNVIKATNYVIAKIREEQQKTIAEKLEIQQAILALLKEKQALLES